MNSYYSIHQLFAEAAYEFSDKAKSWMPEWFTSHKALKELKDSRIFKIFSIFGLKDFREPISDPAILENFIDFISNQLSNVIKNLAQIPESQDSNRLEQITYKLLQAVLNPNMWGDNKHRILTQISSEDKKIRIDAGTSIVKAYGIIKNLAEKFNILLPALETTREFKEYSKRGKMTVVFSTNPEDIAAMSSRSEWGQEHSCQTLDTTRGLNACVVGSTLSKFVGICYITSEKPFYERGEVMTIRALIRFVIDTTNDSPAIYLDKMYPGYYPQFANIMINALQSHTSVPVINYFNLSHKSELGKYRIPEEKIKSLLHHEKSYLDTPAFFSKKLPENDDSIKIVNPNPFFVHFSDTQGVLIGNASANFILNNIAPLDPGEETDFRIASISFGRRLLKLLLRPVVKKIEQHYKNNKQPLSIGFIKKFIKQSLMRKDITSEIRNYINEYKVDGDFLNILTSNSLQQSLGNFLAENIDYFAEQITA